MVGRASISFEGKMDRLEKREVSRRVREVRREGRQL